MASIHVRARKDGTMAYQVAWREKGQQERMTCDSEREAQDWKRLLDANGQSFTVAERMYDSLQMGGPTITEHLTHHVDMLTGVTEYTSKRYRDYIRLHFGDQFGTIKIAAVRREDIIGWIKYMQERGLGPKTIANSHGLLSAGMESAIWQGWRTANPCKGIRLPKDAVGGDDATMVTYEDYRAIEAHMEDHYKPFFGFLVGTGMRFSEATALLASDFKLDAATPTVRVNKAHKQGAEGGRYVGPPKTRKGKRTISLAPSTVELVRPLVESAGERTVFRMPAGGQMTAQAIFNRCWKPARAAAGLDKRVTIHSLRHLHAAMMLGAGMSMYDLSRRLGHNSITISVDLYSHLLPDAQFNGAQVAAKALEGF